MNTLDFKAAFKYPFNRAKGMLNILWILLPILGAFAIVGYEIRLVKEFIRGEFKQLPTFEFGSDLRLGFLMFIKAIPFMVVYIAITMALVAIDPWLRLVMLPFEILVFPVLAINFFSKETVSSLFEFKIAKDVIGNLGDYIMVILKSILLGIIFAIMAIVLVGIPAGAFTKNIFLADFYRRKVKSSNPIQSGVPTNMMGS